MKIRRAADSRTTVRRLGRCWREALLAGAGALGLHVALWLESEWYRLRLGVMIPGDLQLVLAEWRGYHDLSQLPDIIAESSLVLGGAVWGIVGAAVGYAWTALRARRTLSRQNEDS